LDTLCLQKSNTTWGHISLYTTLLIGHVKHTGQMRISCWPTTPKKLQQTNHQDWVFIRPSGISEGAFQLRIDNIWFCKLLLLFPIETKTDAGMKEHACAFVSVLEEYKDHRRPVLHILHILHIIHIYHIVHIQYIRHIVHIKNCFLQHGWMPVSQPSSTSALKQLKACMLF
jgi:hypothetical protein